MGREATSEMSGLSAIRAVTFDVGGTLIEPWPSVGHIYAEIAARDGVKNISPDLLTERFKAAWRERKDFGYARSAWAELVDETFRGLCGKPPSETFFSELYDHFAEPKAWRIFHDVLPTLKELASAPVRLAVISNWDERLRPLLNRLELGKFFEAVIVSCEVGSAKPSAAIFEAAVNELQLAADSILHVGDSFELDVQGARAAGFRAMQIHRSGSPDADSINSLAELPAKLGISANKKNSPRD
jgi:putative hydrolase of the HAD superfamily